MDRCDVAAVFIGGRLIGCEVAVAHGGSSRVTGS
jgi:hypothetical protein